MDKRARRPRSQDVTPRAVPWVGEWPARACRFCRRFTGLRPVAGKMPALPGRHSQGRASGGGVAGSGVSFLSALRGPSARCGQDARAPRTSLPGPCLGWGSGRLGRVVLVGASRAFGPLRARCPRSQDITPKATPWVGEWPARACRSCRRFAGLRPVAGKMPALPGRHSQGRALGGGVAGSGVSFLSALRGPSARCGQDARAPRTSLPGPCLGWGSGRLGRVVLVGASRAFGPLRARCPRSQDVTPRAVPWVGEWPARACRSCRRFAGLWPVAGKMPALPGHRSQGRASGGGVAGSGVSFLSALRGPSARCGQDARAPRTSLPGPCLGWGSGRLGRVVLVGALRAFGPLRARCPRSQGHRSQGRASAFCGAGSEQVSEPDRGLVARQVARTCSVGSVGPGQLEARLVSDHHDCTYCLRRWRRSCSPRMLA